MKLFQKRLCWLLVVCMLLCALPVTVSAAEDDSSDTPGTTAPVETTEPEQTTEPEETTEPEQTTEPEETTAPTEPPIFEEGSCGQEAAWTFDGSDNTLTISGAGMTYDYSSDSPAPWSEYKADIEAVVVEAGISKIGSYAFYGCTALKAVTLPDSVLAVGNYAFASCKALETIVLPKNLEKLSIRMFENCTALKTVLIGEGTTGIETGAFIGCTGMEAIELPETITSIGTNVFSGCTALKTVTLEAKITAIPGSAFYGCSALEEITIPEGITEIGARAFYNCGALETVSLPETLTTIGDSAFYSCTKLDLLALPPKLEAIASNAFSDCEGLTMMAFAGDAPTIAENAFTKVAATAYYPLGNKTWTEEVMVNYGGKITWHPCCVGEHKPALANQKEATCEEKGYTGDQVCQECGIILEAGEAIPALGHDVTSTKPIHNVGTKTHTYACSRCEEGKVENCTYGEPEIIQEATLSQPGIKQYTCADCGGTYTAEFDLEPTNIRIYGENRYETAFAAADTLKENLGVSKFDAVIICCGTDFADALSGSYLAAVKNAPILLTNSRHVDDVTDYVKANLKADGTVYLLGGTKVVSGDFETTLKDFKVVRLYGNNRYETNVEILQEAGVGSRDVLICTGKDFADSLSASATNLPILLVKNGLTTLQKNFLESLNGNHIYIIGGTGAVSEEIEKEIKTYTNIGGVERIGGKNRYETSVLIAHKLVGASSTVVLAYAQNFPDGLCGGPLAVSLGAPLILTADNKDAAAQEYVYRYKISNAVVLGGEALISDKTVDHIFTPMEEPEEKE